MNKLHKRYIKIYPDQEERAKNTWRYTDDKLMPLEPLFELRCPVCGSKNVSYKHRNVFNPYPGQYRIDMHFKCMNCYNIFIFGVPIDEQYFKKIGAGTMHVRNVLR